MPDSCVTTSAALTAAQTSTVTDDTAPEPVTLALSGTAVDGVSEAAIATGGKTIIVTIANTTWHADIASGSRQAQAFIDSFDSAQSEAGAWDAVVNAELTYSDITRNSGTVATLTLPDFDGDLNTQYAITADEIITCNMSSACLAAAYEGADPSFVISNVPEPPTATLSGTIVAACVLEAEIVTGGETLLITLANAEWEATVGADNALTTALFDLISLIRRCFLWEGL